MLGLCSVGQPIAVEFHQAAFSFLLGGTTASASAHGGLAFVACTKPLQSFLPQLVFHWGFSSFPQDVRVVVSVPECDPKNVSKTPYLKGC